MNYKNNLRLMGNVLLVEAFALVIPLIVSFIYKEGFNNAISFIVPCAICGGFGAYLSGFKPESKRMLPKDAFFVVSFAWILMSLVGALPFVINGDIPNFIDAFFETVSGFTTTGASVVNNVNAISHSSIFWRGLTHWIGGMGILVFVLAIMPKNEEEGEGSSMFVLRAESPGPQVGKIASKMTITTRILYLIYIALSIICVCLLLLDKNVGLFNSICLTFSAIATGGFMPVSGDLSQFSSYVQYVLIIFMFLSSINYSLFFLIITKKAKQAFRSEELRIFIGIYVISIVIEMLTLAISGAKFSGFGELFRTSLFEVTSLITTTGFTITSFEVLWPSFAKCILVIVMIIGGMSGSTAGGLKVVRVSVVIKSIWARIKKQIAPRRVVNVKTEGVTLNRDQTESVLVYLSVYVIALIVFTLIISVDGFDMVSNFVASLSCISNVGVSPSLDIISSWSGFSDFSGFSKIILSIEMLVGRLELFPILALFYPGIWRKY